MLRHLAVNPPSPKDGAAATGGCGRNYVYHRLDISNLCVYYGISMAAALMSARRVEVILDDRAAASNVP